MYSARCFVLVHKSRKIELIEVVVRKCRGHQSNDLKYERVIVVPEEELDVERRGFVDSEDHMSTREERHE